MEQTGRTLQKTIFRGAGVGVGVNKSNHWSQGRRAEEIKAAADLSQNERNRGSKNLSSVASNRGEAPCSGATAAARNYAAFRREQTHRRLGEAQSQAGRLDAAPQRVTSGTEVRNRLTPCSCKKNHQASRADQER